MMNIRKFSRKNSAFTLVEILVTIAIFSILMTVMVQFFVDFNQSFVSFSGTADVALSASTVIVEVSTAVRQADQIIPSRTFSSISYTSGTSSVILELPSIDASGNTISGKFDYIVFYSNGANIYKTVESNSLSGRISTTRLLSNTAKLMSFTYDNSSFDLARMVEVDIQTQKEIKGTIISSHLHQRTYLRNI